jgi:3-oxoacyl-[acyl-carrier protein] reductase
MQTCLITGASQGIGYETAIKFALSSYSVIAVSRNKEALLKLETIHPNIKTFAIDLEKKENLKDLINYLQNKNVKIDFLINNAGALINKPFMETDENDWIKMFQANVLTAINVVQVCKNFLKNNTHIVNISSMAGFLGSSKFPSIAAYSVAKGALVTLTEILAASFKEDYIKVNCLCLGAVQTEMLNKAFPGYQASVQANEMATYIYQFTTKSHFVLNGKIIPVSLGTP